MFYTLGCKPSDINLCSGLSGGSTPPSGTVSFRILKGLNMKKPEKFSHPTIGTLDIVSRGKDEYVFIHLTAYLMGKEAENLEKVGRWLIEASEYLKSK